MSAIYTRKLASIVTDTVVAQNVDFLAADFSCKDDRETMVRLTLAVSSAVKVRLVPSSGTGFYLNNGTALVAVAAHTEEIVLDSGRTWNVQTDDAAGTTVHHLHVVEVEA